MTDADLAAAWVSAEDALPPGWRLIALLHSDLAQMAVGLHPALEEDLRTVDAGLTTDGWVALAAGAASDWIVGTGDGPADALRNLADRLQAPTPKG